MKTLIMLLLATASSVVMAGGYYDLSVTEQWQDAPTSRSFSDTRYRARYGAAQVQGFMDQRNAAIIKRQRVEIEKMDLHAQEMMYSAARANPYE